jgi:MYXO-CTERM domain-containing protein
MTSKRVISFSSSLALLLATGVASAAPAKLLITAVSASPTQAEMVAIYNPGNASVDLTNFYLADYATYFEVVIATAIGTTDFVARFPGGASIAPGEHQFVGYGVYPNYELPSSNVADNSPAVPDMQAPFASSIGATHGLTNGGEPVVLFYWDGTSNLVTDIDYVFFGTPSASNPAVNKTGITVNGSTYLADAPDDGTHHAPVSASPAVNTCRSLPFTEGTQAQSGGNGFNGSNETSENTATTFTACTSITVTPGTDAGTGGAGGAAGAGGASGADAGSDASLGGAAGSGGTATGGTAGSSTGGAAGNATGGTAGVATGGTAGAATGGTAGIAAGGSAGSATGGAAGATVGGSGGTDGGLGASGGFGGLGFGGSDGGKLDAGVGGNKGGGASDSGCGCSTVGAPTNSGTLALLSLVGIAFGLRRRR